MTPIVLVAVNARYIHPPFGLMCLKAALGPLRHRSRILEFLVKTPVGAMVEAVAAEEPRVVGLGVYLWNRPQMEALARGLRSRCPGVVLVGGGPELDGLPDGAELPSLLDHVVKGEGEGPFRDLCESVLGASDSGGLPGSAYDEYTDEDLEHRLTYLESARGCPFTCSFCTSANTPGVRNLPLDPLFAAVDQLLARGARRLKFLDRSFNVHPGRAITILDFFLDRLKRRQFFVHFEMVPDRFPPELLERLSRFPPGSLQVEIGIQTLDPSVSKAVHRVLDPEAVVANLEALTRTTRAKVHADLIAGLPGETFEGFGRGFDRLWAAVGNRPGNEIQLGILKRLPGTPLDRTPEPGSVFRTEGPYDLLESPGFTADQLVLLGNMARLWERTINRGKFPGLTDRLTEKTPFGRFFAFTEWFMGRHETSWGIPEQVLGDELAAFVSESISVNSDR